MAAILPESQIRTGIMLGGPGVEGGIDSLGDPTTTWHAAKRLGRVEPTGFGVGFFEEPSVLVGMAGDLRVDDVFLRLEWARVEPRRDGFDDLALTTYLEIVKLLKSHGQRVSVVLSDGSIPNWLGVEGWLAPGTPDRFANYGAVVLEKLGSEISSLVTFEEPARFARSGWMTGSAPPFRKFAPADAVTACDAMMCAHLLVTQFVSQEAPSIGSLFIPTPSRSVDLEALVLGATPGSRIEQKLVKWSPGRAKGLASEVTASEAGLVLGQSPRSGNLVQHLLGGLSEPAPLSFDQPVLAAAIERRAHLCGVPLTLFVRHVAARIDQNGRRLEIHGHRRATELASVLGAAQSASAAGAQIKRVVLGELVDRWFEGSYHAREGIFGVDRTRGPRGVTLLSSDAAGVAASVEMNELLARS